MIRRIVTVRKTYQKGEHQDASLKFVHPDIIAAYSCDIAMTDQEVKEFQDILMAEHFVEEKVDDGR